MQIEIFRFSLFLFYIFRMEMYFSVLIFQYFSKFSNQKN